MKKHIIELIVIHAGTAVVALSYYLLMKPVNVVAPGLGGIAMIIGFFIPVSLGIIYFLLNIPLFLVGYRYVGGKFVVYSMVGMISLSFYLSLFDQLSGFHQPIVGSLLGGALSGAAIAFILLAGGSTGGMDIASVVLNRLIPSWTIGRIMFVLNALIVLLSGYLFGYQGLLLTLLSIFSASKTLDFCYLWGIKRQPRVHQKGSNSINHF